MGLLDKLLGREEEPRRDTPGRAPGSFRQDPPPGYGAPAGGPGGSPRAGAGRSEDEVAVERYRYMLRTAPPEAVEEAHAEAFEKLTPEQRRQVLAELGEQVPPGERGTSDSPRDLARMATRAEVREPGTLERTLGRRGGAGGGPGLGTVVGGSLLGTVAGVVIGSAVASSLFGDGFGDPGTDVAADGADGGDPGGADGTGDLGDPGAGDLGGDAGAGDGGGLFGGDGGGFFGGDGGGDFGGGDF